MDSVNGDDMVDMATLRAMLGVSRGRAYTVSKERGFPEPAVARTRFRAWNRSDVETWMDQHRPGWRGEGRGC